MTVAVYDFLILKLLSEKSVVQIIKSDSALSLKNLQFVMFLLKRPYRGLNSCTTLFTSLKYLKWYDVASSHVPTSPCNYKVFAGSNGILGNSFLTIIILFMVA